MWGACRWDRNIEHLFQPRIFLFLSVDDCSSVSSAPLNFSTINKKHERRKKSERKRERERRETVRESFNQFLQQRLPKRRRIRNISVASDVRAKSELMSEKSNHERLQQSLEWFKKLELALILFKVVMWDSDDRELIPPLNQVKKTQRTLSPSEHWVCSSYLLPSCLF